ncbi:MAG TPA: LptA/OstA family protein [Pseudomonadales bacterium]|jgi:lipopolysaccharide transport protein LptA
MLKRFFAAELASAIALALVQLSCSAWAGELPALDDQDTVVVTADQAWESEDGDSLSFAGNFNLNAPDFHVASDTAVIHGPLEDPNRIVAEGSPVRFWVADPDSGNRTHGTGRRLEYDRQRDLVRLEGDAVLEDDRTVMRSSELEYNTATKRLVAQGSGGVEIVTNPNRD